MAFPFYCGAVGAVAVPHYEMSKMLFCCHLWRIGIREKKKKEKKYKMFGFFVCTRMWWARGLPAVIKKSSFSMTNNAVTGPGFGGSERIRRPECISNIRARASSQPMMAR